jgi:hypothetical protein
VPLITTRPRQHVGAVTSSYILHAGRDKDQRDPI